MDGEPLSELVLSHAAEYDLGENAVTATLCDSLAEASGQSYFYEALLPFAGRRVPYGDAYRAWLEETARRMSSGQDLYFLGR